MLLLLLLAALVASCLEARRVLRRRCDVRSRPDTGADGAENKGRAYRDARSLAGYSAARQKQQALLRL